MAGACGFCDLKEASDQKVILRHPTVLFVQNEKAQGALRGSGVIIPVRHAETVFDLTADELLASCVVHYNVSEKSLLRFAHQWTTAP
jgi:hypothetical protein